jgi:pimeloyl-ACP methyl ester carboxylesterase
MRRLLGLRDLVHDAIHEITNLVEETQEAAAQKPMALLTLVEPVGRVARGVDEVRRGVARAVFDGVRGTNRGVQALCDQGIVLATAALERAGFERWSDLEPEGARGDARLALDAWVDRAESALNGVIGDFLAARGNPLATRMSLRRGGIPVPLSRSGLSQALPAATGKLCIFVHGLACSDSVWRPAARTSEISAEIADEMPEVAARAPLDFAVELERAHGYTSFDLRYNTGLHISENGRALAQLLSELTRVYPVPIDQIALVGHSMGGLVVRSAAHYAEQRGEPWLTQLTHVLSIASPHFGAPLARVGHVVSTVTGLFDTAATQVSAKVLRARSAGIKDLSFGALLDDDGPGGAAEASLFGPQQSCPFVPGVAYGYVAARFRPSGVRDSIEGSSSEGGFGEWLGDLLVHLPSASGKHDDPARQLPFHMGHVIEGAHHVALTTHPDVYHQLERFLTECQP